MRQEGMIVFVRRVCQADATECANIVKGTHAVPTWRSRAIEQQNVRSFLRKKDRQTNCFPAGNIMFHQGFYFEWPHFGAINRTRTEKCCEMTFFE